MTPNVSDRSSCIVFAAKERQLNFFQSEHFQESMLVVVLSETLIISCVIYIHVHCIYSKKALVASLLAGVHELDFKHSKFDYYKAEKG